jgi:hypothetical protein
VTGPATQAPTSAPAAGPVQGPAAPTYTDLIWATAASAAAIEDPHLTVAGRLPCLQAECAAYTAAAHLGVDEASAEAYAAELEQADLAVGARMDANPDAPALAEWAAVLDQPEAGL